MKGGRESPERMVKIVPQLAKKGNRAGKKEGQWGREENLKGPGAFVKEVSE